MLKEFNEDDNLRKQIRNDKVKIWPNNFESRDIFSKYEKEIMREAKKSMKDGVFVAGVNPVGKGKMHRISYYLSTQYGVISFLVIDVEKDKALQYIDMYLEAKSDLEEKLLYKLLDSKALIEKVGNKKILNIQYKNYVLFQNISYNSLKLKDKKEFEAYNENILFKNFIDVNGQSIVAKLKLENNLITKVQFNAVIERFSPEYSIVINEKEEENDLKNKRNINTKENSIEINITGKESEYKVFALDDEQVNLVNEISYGHRLILANPGAGKSVILLAKAFRMCRLYEQEKVLVTCFNNNLADAYRFRKNCSGFIKSDNLYISTFHKMVLDIVRYKLGFKLFINDFDKALDMLENELDKGTLNLNFRAIFIDEVQIFEPRWLDICYKLLDKNDKSIFLIAGDLNQDLKNMSKNGKAVWQMTKMLPSNFRGRVKYINKNYRNGKEICDYINKQLDFMILKTEQMNLKKSEEFNIKTYGDTNKKGGGVELQLGINRTEFKSSIKNKVRKICDEGKIDASDIVIILPFKQHKSFKYYPYIWVKQALEEEGIQYRIIFNDDFKRDSNYDGQGVVISTIDVALGLDFKVVILTGLYPLAFIRENNSFIKIKSWNELANKDEAIREAYINGLKKIYVACSRARDNLYIISDIDINLPIDEFLRVGR